MPTLDDTWRQTGRTTRMLEQVAEDEGYIVVICANHRERSRLADEFAHMTGGRRVGGNHEPKVYTDRTEVTFQPSTDLDWSTRTIHGMFPRPIYIDHHALEQQMGWMLREWLETVPDQDES